MSSPHELPDLSSPGEPTGTTRLAATAAETGELIVAAIRSGATRIVVGSAGSATTDGGLGALEAIEEAGGIGHVDLLVACDVTVRFVDAARMSVPQKGASPVQVELLKRRLTEFTIYQQGVRIWANYPGN